MGMDSWREFEQHLFEIDSHELAMDWMKRSIYKVPASIKDLNPKAYIPQFVTFGPYHCNYVRGTEMDVHKHRALNHFIRKSGKPLIVYVNAMQEIQHELMASYESLDVNLHSSADKFLQHMLLDGCFMLEIIHADAAIDDPEDIYEDYSVNDPIFSYHGKLYVMPYIRRDMLMLENQIPMFLLIKLLMVAANDADNQDQVLYLNKMMLIFIRPTAYHFHRQIDCHADSRSSLHVLDLYRKSLIDRDYHRPTNLKKIDKLVRYFERHNTSADVRSAEKLRECAIDFRPSETTFLTDISFDQGKLKLPSVIVDDCSEVVFLNLIAFERVHVGAGNEVTSYVFIMSSIISSAKDVNFLITSNIIVNFLGSEKSVADFFSGISREITPDLDSDLESIYYNVQAYSTRNWKVWLVNLKDNLENNYFKNPWTFLTFLAASFVILLAVVQTIYAILSYYKPEKK